MSDYYHQFLSSMSGMEGHPVNSPDEMSPPSLSGGSIGMSSGSMPLSYQNMGYFAGFSESVGLNTSKNQKGRRKSGSGSATGMDHVKHRRTRSGCFMCRSRRVKCDETRPTCERCKKGNRECVYPEPPAPKGTSGQSAKSKDPSLPTRTGSPTSSNDEEEDDDDGFETKLETIPDCEVPDELSRQTTSTQTPRTMSTTSSGTRQWGSRPFSESPSQEDLKNLSSSVSAMTTGSVNVAALQLSEPPITPGGGIDWPSLPPDFRHYLTYYVENVTNYHYSLVHDGDEFFRNILPQAAIQNEPLLYALVGFSAYHATLRSPNGKLEDFLQYYNKSVTLLLGSLKRKETRNISTLLTILQLATIEEYLGDWINLMGHQKAAFEIITTIFTPQSIMQTPVGRTCLGWYARFDNFVALMGGFPTDLPRDWFTCVVDYYQTQMKAHPEVVRWKTDELAARLHLISYDMSILYARGSRGQISTKEFTRQHDHLSNLLVEWKNTWDPMLFDPKYLVQTFPNKQAIGPDDIVDPYTPGIIYDAPLFKSTLLTVEWHSIMIMHESQSSSTPPHELFAKLGEHAYTCCQYFAALEYWPSTPKGTLISLQAALAISALFLPQDARHHMWLRKKFALMHMLGYIHPITRRMKMAELFREPACAHWWLPNDEGLTPVLQSIRSFADERNAKAVNSQQENLREVRHIFAKLETGEYAEALQGKGPASTG